MPNGTHKLDFSAGMNPGGICIKCHQLGFSMTPAKIEEEKARYNAALNVLQEALAGKGMPYTPHYPYFANKNWNSVGPVGGTGKQNMGAAFNFSLLKHEPGGFAHNRIYARRLIFDSIDYLQHGRVTGTVDFSTFTSSSVAAASAYLGSTRP